VICLVALSPVSRPAEAAAQPTVSLEVDQG